MNYILAAVAAMTIYVALAQITTFPAHNGSCPAGASHAGSGYCRSTSGKSFIPAIGGSCPAGTSHAGAGYCSIEGGTVYVPVNNGSCPASMSHAGAGYCRGR